MTAPAPPPSWHEAAVLISNHQAWHGDGLPQVMRVRPHRTFRWCWDCGLRRVDPWRIDDHEHAQRLPCGCIITKED